MRPISFLLAAAVAATASAAQAQYNDRWGVLVFGPNREWAWSINQPSPSAALDAATEACGPTCGATLVFPWGCAAVATGADGAIGISTTRFAARARAWALNRCERSGADCEIVAVVCTGPGTETLDQTPPAPEPAPTASADEQ